MNVMKKYLVCLTVFLIAIFISCDNIIDKDLNVDPDRPSDASSDLILTGIEVGAMGLHSGEMSRVTGLWSGYFKGIDRQDFGYYNYLVLNSDFDGKWSRVYDIMRNSVVLEKKLEEEGKEGIVSGINKILRAQTIGVATSLWGDIPYSEAGSFVENRNPKYDNQVDIYDRLQKLLNEAIEELKSPLGRPAKGADIFFDGDPNAWERVAYTLKARLYMHTKNYSKAYDNALLGIMDPEENLQTVHYEENDSQNLYYQFYNGNRGGELYTNETFFFELFNPLGNNYRGNSKTDENARFNFFTRKLSSSQHAPNTSDDGRFGKTQPFPLITFEENLLILAESGAITQGFNLGLGYLNQLREYYNSGEGIGSAYQSEAYKYESYTDDDFEAGQLMAVEGLSKNESLLREILVEKYISLYPQIETFNDLRRTFDESYAVPVEPNTADGIFPQRFIYPQSEIDRNSNMPSDIPDITKKTNVNR